MMPFEFYLVFIKGRYYNNAIHKMEISLLGVLIMRKTMKFINYNHKGENVSLL